MGFEDVTPISSEKAAVARQLAADAPHAITAASGSYIDVGRTRRAMKQYAVLDTDLARLSASNRLVTICGALASGAFAFSGSCWLQLQQETIAPVFRGRIEMGEWMSAVVGLIFLGLAGWGAHSEWTLIRQIRQTSTDITSPS